MGNGLECILVYKVLRAQESLPFFKRIILTEQK